MTSEPLAISLAAKSLDGLFMRMAAIAQNVANTNSPTYQPVKVEFEAALRDAAGKGSASVEALHFGFTADRAYRASEDRRLDLLIADAAQTSMRYSALVDMLGRRLSLQAEAIGGQ